MIEGACHCGKVKWTYSNPVDGVTACNCNLCRRYGALWAYGHLDHGISVSGPTDSYQHSRAHNGFYRCQNCGCVAYYLANKLDDQGRRRIAVNIRIAQDPEQVAQFPIDHFEGLVSFEDLPRDGRCVKDLWF